MNAQHAVILYSEEYGMEVFEKETERECRQSMEDLTAQAQRCFARDHVVRTLIQAVRVERIES